MDFIYKYFGYNDLASPSSAVRDIDFFIFQVVKEFSVKIFLHQVLQSLVDPFPNCGTRARTSAPEL